MARLEAQAVEARLWEIGQDHWEIAVEDEVESTNDAVLLGYSGRPRALFAETQTRGRGRRGAAWFTGSAGDNLAFSCALDPGLPLEKWSRVTHVAALAVSRALQEWPPATPLIKWPNDIYLRGRKVCGILVESYPSRPCVVIGVGVNVNGAAESFPLGLAALATSLRAETRTWIDRAALAAMILAEMGELLGRANDGFPTLLEEIRRNSWLLGRNVRAKVGSDSVTGLAEDLGEDGQLILRLENGARRELLSAEEVRLA